MRVINGLQPMGDINNESQYAYLICNCLILLTLTITWLIIIEIILAWWDLTIQVTLVAHVGAIGKLCLHI